MQELQRSVLESSGMPVPPMSGSQSAVDDSEGSWEMVIKQSIDSFSSSSSSPLQFKSMIRSNDVFYSFQQCSSPHFPNPSDMYNNNSLKRRSLSLSISLSLTFMYRRMIVVFSFFVSPFSHSALLPFCSFFLYINKDKRRSKAMEIRTEQFCFLFRWFQFRNIQHLMPFTSNKLSS